MSMNLEALLLSDLDFGAPVPRHKGRPKVWNHVYDRDLTEEDIQAMIEAPNAGTRPPSLLQLRTSHHQLARLLADGRTAAEAALVTGYSQNRISLLLDDPAFMELLHYYQGQVDEVYINVHERLAAFGIRTLEELQERLESNPDSFTNKELRELMSVTLDRGGYGPKSTQVHETKIDVKAFLDDIKAEVARKNNGRITTLDAKAKAPEDRGPSAGGNTGRPTLVYSVEEAPGNSGEGSDL